MKILKIEGTKGYSEEDEVFDRLRMLDLSKTRLELIVVKCEDQDNN
jgi:hypothetical protein